MVLTLMKNILNKFNYTLLCLLCLPLVCWSHGYYGHNSELRRILFGNADIQLSKKGCINLRLLYEAAFMTLDYTYQDVGKEYLKDLKENGVKDVPDFTSIAFPGNQRHQKYTHRGWNFVYVKDRANWSARKKLLLSTVDEVCNFSNDEKIKKDAFAALIYEFHVLGDHIGDSEYTKFDRIRLVSEPDYRGQTISPTSDGPFNNPTLYTYFIYHIHRLFREQQQSYEFRQLIGFLNRHKDEFANSKERQVPYENIQFLAQKTRDELIRYFPILLSREKFYKRAFF